MGALASERGEASPAARITVVYNNVPHAPGLATAWGFAAVVDSGGERVLFDTGGDGPTLLANLERVGIEPGSVAAVVLSHAHGDHTGGLDGFLARRSPIPVYLPESSPAALRRAVERRGARVETVGGPRRLRANLYSTGELGEGTREQALIVDTPAGLVVVTGCAHPGVAEVVRAPTSSRAAAGPSSTSHDPRRDIAAGARRAVRASDLAGCRGSRGQPQGPRHPDQAPERPGARSRLHAHHHGALSRHHCSVVADFGGRKRTRSDCK